MYNGLLLVFDKSYHDSTNNENSSQSIIVFNVHSMLRDIEYETGLCRCLASIMVERKKTVAVVGLRSTTHRDNSSCTHEAHWRPLSMNVYGVRAELWVLSLSQWRKVDLPLALWQESGPNLGAYQR